MNRELVQTWLDALRSGEYFQGKMMLKSPGLNEYCCLGVAAEACFGATWEYGPYIETQAALFDQDVEKLGLDAVLDDSQREAIADRLAIPVDEIPTSAQSIAMFMNDTVDASFDTIADVMEEVLLKAGVPA